MSGLLTKRRFSQMPPARRISGPVDGSFVHVDSTTADLSSSINYGTPIASTSAQPIDMANNKQSKFARRLTKTFTSPFPFGSSNSSPSSELSTSRISLPVAGTFTTLTHSPAGLASNPVSPLVFPGKPKQKAACRATYCAPSSSTDSMGEAVPRRGYTTHSQRHHSMAIPRVPSPPSGPQLVISEAMPDFTIGSPSFAAFSPLSGDTTPALGSYTPRTPGGGPKRIARKPVPAAALAEVDFGAVPRLSLSYTSNTAEKRRSTAAELEGGLFAPAPVELRVEVAGPGMAVEAEEVTPVEGLTARLFSSWGGGRRASSTYSPTSSPRLALPSRPYALGQSPALPPLPTNPSLSDELDSAAACDRARHCPSPAQSSSSSTCSSASSSSNSDVLTVPRLSTGSDATTVSSASSSCTCPVTGSWQWGNPQTPASLSPLPSPLPSDGASFRLGTPSLEDSRGKKVKRSSVWLPTRVQNGGKMFQLSPVLSSASPTVSEDAWGQGGQVEQWSGDVLEITLGRS